MPLDPTPFLDTAVARGLLNGPFRFRPLAGNLDRRPDLERFHWHVSDTRGLMFKLTIGPGLDSIRERSDEFHTALPLHSPATRFFFRAAGRDVWAQAWVEGTTPEESLNNLDGALNTVRALDTLEEALASTTRPSTSVAWEQEFETWSIGILDLPVWTSPENGFLVRTLLPTLRVALGSNPQTRWTNGDFTSANIRFHRLNPTLLDFEHGGRTHFFNEDHARFLRLSPAAHRHPGLFGGLWPEIAPAWEAFFQLRQLGLEAAVNTPEYLKRVVTERKGLLHSAFQAMGLLEPAWSVLPRPIPPEFAQETVQMFWKLGADWTEANSRRMKIRRGEKQFVAFRLPRSATGFLRLDPTATSRSSTVHAVCLIDADGQIQDALPAVSVAGAIPTRLPEGLHVVPLAADPQLLIPISQSVKFLLAEISIS